MYLVKCIVIGFLIGSIYYKLEDGDIQARMSLFALLYLSLSLLIVDDLEALYRRKDLFLRESFVEASNFISYYLSDGLPATIFFSIGSFCTLIIVYLLAGLRPTLCKYIYCYSML